MTGIDPSFANFIGIPYMDKGRGMTGCDCWGLCRLALSQIARISLPDYSDTYTRAGDHASVAAAVEAGLKDGWVRVARPIALDLVIIRVGGRPWHAGLAVSPTTFLHVPPPGRNGHQSFSCIERLDNPQWANRIEGFYRSTMATSN